MFRILRRISIIIGITIGTFLFLFFALILYFNGLKLHDISIQKKHNENLKALNYSPVDEQTFVEFDLFDETIRLNEIQVLASHNSYKKLGPAIGRFFVGLGENFEEAKLLKYGNNSLTDQFNHGVRSIELDVRYRKNDFEVIHVPLVDNRSTIPNFRLALEEIKLWSDTNPNHIPITVLLELKNDWMILDPQLCEFTQTSLTKMDELLKETFADKLLTPKDVIGESNNLKEAIITNGWPLLKDTLGKVIFILHPGSYTNMYVEMDSTFMKMAMFPAASNTNIDNTYASFIVHNEVNVEAINNLVQSNFIVRTRVDSKLIPDLHTLEKGIISGAQILTSDFHSNHNFKNHPYIAFLKDNFTVIKRASS